MRSAPIAANQSSEAGGAESSRPGPDLSALFAPTSIAVVGASPDRNKPGGRALFYLSAAGYQGRVFAVNPRYETIDGQPAYAGLDDLPEPADLAIIIVPAAKVVDSLRAAGRVGVRGAVVCSSGFAEAGADGVELEQELRATANASGLALLGPNCLGYVDDRHGVVATFTTALQVDSPTASGAGGGIAFVSQSGALGAGIFSVGRMHGVGLGMFVSTGNEACLGMAEIVHYLASDDGLTTVLGYIEGMRDGRSFVAAARTAREHGKQVAVVKVGQTSAGARASQSHTGALTGEAELWEAAFRRAGVVHARDLQHLLDIGIATDSCRAVAGPRLGIVSMSGGAAALMADRAAAAGLQLPLLQAATLRRLADTLPSYAGMTNPVDYGAIYGDLDAIEQALRAVIEAPELDTVALFVGLTPRYAGQLESRLIRVAAEAGKPLLVAWLGASDASLAELRAGGVPAYDDPTRMIDAAAALVDGAASLPEDLPVIERRETTGVGFGELLAADRTAPSERQLIKALAKVGLPVVEQRFAGCAEEAVLAAQSLAGPVAVKAEAEGMLHKSDVGAVELNATGEGVAAAYERVVAAARSAGYPVTGAVVARMAPPGLELIIGARWDPQFGPTVLVGAGGVTAEVLRDVRVELAPISRERAAEMLGQLRIAPLLTGFRGEPGVDVGAVADVIATTSRVIAGAGGRLAELDLNPVVAYPEGEGCLILDAGAVLAER